jgi:hypothetical protein
MPKKSSPMPTPAENSIANQEKLLNSGLLSSSPSLMLPKRLNIR